MLMSPAVGCPAAGCSQSGQHSPSTGTAAQPGGHAAAGACRAATGGSCQGRGRRPDHERRVGCREQHLGGGLGGHLQGATAAASKSPDLFCKFTWYLTLRALCGRQEYGFLRTAGTCLMCGQPPAGCNDSDAVRETSVWGLVGSFRLHPVSTRGQADCIMVYAKQFCRESCLQDGSMLAHGQAWMVVVDVCMSRDMGS